VTTLAHLSTTPISIGFGPNHTPIRLTARTPSAVVEAAHKAVDDLSIVDLRALMVWSDWQRESVFDGTFGGADRAPLSLVGIVAVWIASEILGLDLCCEDDEEEAFLADLLSIAPRIAPRTA